MQRVLLISKAKYPDTPVVVVRVLSFDATTKEMSVEGRDHHRWQMSVAEAKRGFDRFVQEIDDAECTGVQARLSARGEDRQGAG